MQSRQRPLGSVRQRWRVTGRLVVGKDTALLHYRVCAPGAQAQVEIMV